MRTLSISALAFAVAISVSNLGVAASPDYSDFRAGVASPTVHTGPVTEPQGSTSDNLVAHAADFSNPPKPPGVYCTGPEGIRPFSVAKPCIGQELKVTVIK